MCELKANHAAPAKPAKPGKPGKAQGGGPAAPGAPPAPPVDPYAVLRQATGGLKLPLPDATVNPYNKIGGQAPGTLVGVPVWVWVNSAQWHPLHNTVSVGGVTVTVTATPKDVTFYTGAGGGAQACDGPGTPWTGGDPKSASPDCGYTYTSASPSGQPFASRVSVTWSGHWTSNVGLEGDLAPIYRTSEVPIGVYEAQAVNK